MGPMSVSPFQLREVFHFLFLERLLRIADPRLFVLKGGVNMRFFFSSPRYSEDMDLDVLGGGVGTLTKNGYRILGEPAFARALRTYGISEVVVNNPASAKQTATTQRFRARLVTDSGESYPTKVEFSRRRVADDYRMETIDPDVAARYRRLSFPCQHYPAPAAFRQKALALANRPRAQVRDAFDLYLLWLGGNVPQAGSLPEATRELAQRNLLGFTFSDYQGQVLEYLEPAQRNRFETENSWSELCERVFSLIEAL